MFNYLTWKDFAFFSLILGFSYLGFWILVQAKYRRDLVNKYLYIPSGKSESSAVLLGGVVFSIISIFGVIYFSLLKTKSFYFHINPYAYTVGALILTTIGYLDDKFEIRARQKLAGQFISLFVFSLIAMELPDPKLTLLLQFCYSALGIVILNGSNLLDGMDTLTVKMSLTTYLLFMIIAYNFSSQGVLYLSMIFMAPTISFYFFNKYPSKVHLGEAGSTMYGLTYICIASTLFMHLEDNTSNTVFKNVMLATLPLNIYFFEVLVSFFRRLFNGTSPFSGDKLHFHYILRDKYKMTDSKATSLYAAIFFVVSVIAFYFMDEFAWPLIGVSISVSLLFIITFIPSRKYWFFKEDKNLFLVDKKVKDKAQVISNELLSGIDIEISEPLDKESE